MKQTYGVQKVANSLPKPVVDRIHRYAKEGRQPGTRLGQDSCSLLALAFGQLPVVILRSNPKQFTAVRSAALSEWTRAARLKPAWRASR